MRRFGKAASTRGFTLAELLIALAILGVIATFTIPKILTGQADRKANAIAKEAAGILSGAYQEYRRVNGWSADMQADDLKQFINYVKYDTTTTVDNIEGQNAYACDALNPCLLLHNGAMIHYVATVRFGGTLPTNGIPFHIDPDGKYGGSTTGASKPARMILYYTGRITNTTGMEAGTTNSGGSIGACCDPTWFSW